MLRLIIAGGGTGGHLFAGLAVAAKAVKKGAEVLFIGSEDGIEATVLPKEGFKLVAIKAGKFKGMGIGAKMKTVGMLPAGVAEARRAIKDFNPQVVMGVGGYASFPAVVAAKLSGVPVIIQEQNAMPGLSNRTLGKVADVVAVGFRESAGYFPRGKAVFTGNPVRPELLRADKKSALAEFGLHEGRLTVLVFGGSAGAHRINRGVTEALAHMKDVAERVQFIHVTGETDYLEVEKAYEGSGFAVSVHPFVFEMAKAYACADLVICRSGALTLAEVTALGKPAVLIPYPYAADNHQELNARALEKSGAARVVLDSDAKGKRMADEITKLVLDPDALTGMAGRSLSMGRADSADKVLGLCRDLAKKYKA